MDEKNLLELEEALNLSSKEAGKLYSEYLNPTFAALLKLLNINKKFVYANGTEVWDEDGNRYLDFLGGFGSLNLGHNPKEVIEAVEKVKSRPNLLHLSLNALAACLAHNLSQITPGNLKNCFFCNSGAEAVEGALKLARAATGRQKIIYCEDSFHGKTMGALSVTGRFKYQQKFKPLVPDCQPIPYGDVNVLEKVLKDGEVAAFIVEPIQGEGGIIMPPEGYLREVRELCTKYEILLIADEVQTGLGRTGKIFACEWEDIVPDVMCLAKSLGGGIIPIGAFITTEKHWNKAYGTTETCTLHTSTFGGNSWACAAGIEAVNQTVKNNLASKALQKGNYLLKKLLELKESYKLIRDVRGKGLMIGVEFENSTGSLSRLTKGISDKLSREYLGAMIAGELFNRHRIITAYTLNNPNVIRLEPPLIVKYEQLDEMIDALEDTLSRNSNIIKFTFSTAKTAVKSILDR